MGCTKSKIDPKICGRDETNSMHVAYIKKHGLEKYYQTMGIEPEEKHNSYEDNSKNLNLGLINIEEKTESDVENINMGVSTREWVEIAVLLIIVIGILRVIYKFCIKQRKKWVGVDGCGWVWMGVGGCGWVWVGSGVVDGCGWVYMS